MQRLGRFIEGGGLHLLLSLPIFLGIGIGAILASTTDLIGIMLMCFGIGFGVSCLIGISFGCFYLFFLITDKE